MEDPKFFTASSKNLGFLIAAEFIKTLSAPFFKINSISLSVLIPPPTETGINTFDEVLLIRSNKYGLF